MNMRAGAYALALGMVIWGTPAHAEWSAGWSLDRITAPFRRVTNDAVEDHFHFESHCPQEPELPAIPKLSHQKSRAFQFVGFPCLTQNDGKPLDEDLIPESAMETAEMHFIRAAIDVRKEQIGKSRLNWQRITYVVGNPAAGISHLDEDPVIALRIRKDWQNLVLLRQVQEVRAKLIDTSYIPEKLREACGKKLSAECDTARKQMDASLAENEASILHDSPILGRREFNPLVSRLFSSAPVPAALSEKEFFQTFRDAGMAIQKELFEHENELDTVFQDDQRLASAIRGPEGNKNEQMRALMKDRDHIRHDTELLQELILATDSSSDPKLAGYRPAECRLESRVIGDGATGVMRGLAVDVSLAVATAGASAYFQAGKGVVGLSRLVRAAPTISANLAVVGVDGARLIAKQKECQRINDLVFSGVSSGNPKFESDLRQCNQDLDSQTLMFGMNAAGSVFSDMNTVRSILEERTVGMNALRAEKAVIASAREAGSASDTMASRFSRSPLFTEKSESRGRLSQIYEELSGESETAKRKAAGLEEAHQVGIDNQGAYSKAELKRKTKILLAAGFSKSDADLLIRSGVAGKYNRVVASRLAAGARGANLFAELSELDPDSIVVLQSKSGNKYRMTDFYEDDGFIYGHVIDEKGNVDEAVASLRKSHLLPGKVQVEFAQLRSLSHPEDYVEIFDHAGVSKGVGWPLEPSDFGVRKQAGRVELNGASPARNMMLTSADVDLNDALGGRVQIRGTEINGQVIQDHGELRFIAYGPKQRENFAMILPNGFFRDESTGELMVHVERLDGKQEILSAAEVQTARPDHQAQSKFAEIYPPEKPKVPSGYSARKPAEAPKAWVPPQAKVSVRSKSVSTSGAQEILTTDGTSIRINPDGKVTFSRGGKVVQAWSNGDQVQVGRQTYRRRNARIEIIHPDGSKELLYENLHPPKLHLDDTKWRFHDGVESSRLNDDMTNIVYSSNGKVVVTIGGESTDLLPGGRFVVDRNNVILRDADGTVRLVHEDGTTTILRKPGPMNIPPRAPKAPAKPPASENEQPRVKAPVQRIGNLYLGDGITHPPEYADWLKQNGIRESSDAKKSWARMVLQVGPNATAEELKSAKRRLWRLYHPDYNPTDPESTETTRLIAEAFDFLDQPKL